MVKIHYNLTTRELADAANLSMPTIRHWKLKGLLKGCYSQSKRDFVYHSNNMPFYWVKDKTKKRLEKIIELRENGHSIEEIKIILKV